MRHTATCGTALGLLLFSFLSDTSLAATNLVTNTNDTGPGSLRAAITNANAVAGADVIAFSIAGTGPHTITPATPLPNLTDAVIVDGYTQSGASQNTLANGDNAVLKIVVLGTLIVDTTNSTIRGLAIHGIDIGAAPGANGGNVVEGNFIGLDATGTNSFNASRGVFAQTPNNRIGGTSPGSRNVIAGHQQTGIEIFEAFATNNVVLGNFIGTDKSGTIAIGIGVANNADGRGVVVNMASHHNTIGGTASGARNLISGIFGRGITLDGSTNVVQGNFVGTDVTGLNPLGNQRSGVEIGGVGNLVGGTNGGGNAVAFNGYDGMGATTNGVDVKDGTTGCAILGNSIFDNFGLGIGGSDAPVPVITNITRTATTTTIMGTVSNAATTLIRLEFFTNPTCDPSGNGEGKTFIGFSNVTTSANGTAAFSVTVPVSITSSEFITATATAAKTSNFSLCQQLTSPGGTNSWTNSVSGKWEADFNWSLGFAPALKQAATLITNAATKTVTIDATTGDNSPGSMTISNLTIGAPGGAVNTLALNNAGNTPLRVLSSLMLTNGSALTAANSILRVDGLNNRPFSSDGNVQLNSSTLIVTSAFTVVGSSGIGAMNVSSSTGLVGVLYVGYNNGAQGTLNLLNSQLLGTNGFAPAYVGFSGAGQMTLSNSTWLVDNPVYVAFGSRQATLTLVGSTGLLGSGLVVAFTANTTGSVSLTGSRLEIEGSLGVGSAAKGQWTASNSFVRVTDSLLVGSQFGSHGTYTAFGGTNQLGEILVGNTAGAIGSVFLANGQLVLSNTSVTVGNSGVGALTLSNVNANLDPLFLAKNPGALGTFTVAGGTTTVSSIISAGIVGGATSSVFVTGGQLLLTQNPTLIGGTGLVQMAVSGGSVQMTDLTVNSATAPASLTVAGGMVDVAGQLDCLGAGTALNISGGQLTALNGNTFLGHVAISGTGSFLAREIFLGNQRVGSITISGGLLALPGVFNNGLIVGANGGTGTVVQTGGQIITTNTDLSIGGLFSPAVGTVIVSNGTLLAHNIFVGGQGDGHGTLTIAGGTNIISGRLEVGLNPGATGTVWLTGGQFTLSNAPANIGSGGTGRMTVSNGNWRANSTVTVGDGDGAKGELTVAGGTNVFSSFLTIADQSTATGTVWLTGGQLVVTNQRTLVGASGVGQLTLSNGTFLAQELIVADSPGSTSRLTVAGGTLTAKQLIATNSGATVELPAGTMTLGGANVSKTLFVGAPGRAAVLNLVGGTNHFSTDLMVGAEAGATGTVSVTAGQLEVNVGADPLVIVGGSGGNGHMIVSNHTWLSRIVLAGYNGGSGTLTFAGGTNSFQTLNAGASSLGSTGIVWMSGGRLDTSFITVVGQYGFAQMTVSNGTWQARNVIVGNVGGSHGTLTIAGGVSSVSSNLTIGFTACTATGIVNVAGGSLFVTNLAGNATIEVRSGTLSINGGLLQANRIVITNSCAQFVRTGGTLNYGTVVLNPGADTDGDGFTNQQEASMGTDPLDPNSTPGAGQLSVSPGTLLFGTTATGLTAQASFVVTNLGTGTLSGSAAFTNGPFAVVSGSPFNLGGHGSANVVISFTPSAHGAVTNKVIFSSNGGSSTNTVIGTGIAFPPGDVNGTNGVTSADSLLINQVLVGLRSSNDAIFAKAGFANGDVNATNAVSGADSLLINQVLVGLRGYATTKILPGSHSSNETSAVVIFGVGFPTNSVPIVTIGAPVNLTLTNVIVNNRERITATIPPGGGLGTGAVNVVSSPTNGVISFGRFSNQ